MVPLQEFYRRMLLCNGLDPHDMHWRLTRFLKNFISAETVTAWAEGDKTGWNGRRLLDFWDSTVENRLIYTQLSTNTPCSSRIWENSSDVKDGASDAEVRKADLEEGPVEPSWAQRQKLMGSLPAQREESTQSSWAQKVDYSQDLKLNRTDPAGMQTCSDQ